MKKPKLIRKIELINMAFNISSIITAISLGLITIISICFLPPTGYGIKSSAMLNVVAHFNANILMKIILILLIIFIFAFSIRAFLKYKYKDFII